MIFLSIIIPTYNRKQCIKAALNSVLNQGFNNVEIIVVDDGSTDATKEVLFEFIENNKIIYLFQENKGVCAARNSGARIAKGEYLLFLDSDDVLFPDSISHFYSLSKSENCQMLFGDMERRESNQAQSIIVKARNPYGKGIGKGLYLAGAFCIKRDLYHQIEGYDESIKYGENAELKFKIEQTNPSIAFLDQVVLGYNVSEEGGSKSLTNMIHSNEYLIQKHKSYFKQYPKVLQLYLQNNAVAYTRLKKFNEARQSIINAWMAHPISFKTFLRMLIMIFPFISKHIWK